MVEILWRKLLMTVLMAGFLLLVACGGQSIEGKWEDSTGAIVEITEDAMKFGEDMGMALEIDLKHIKDDLYEISMMGETEEVTLNVDGDELTMEHVSTGESEVLTRAE
ncbi:MULTISPECIES: hypothetical protein [Allobacillus]|uniref:DUF5640 domain-containing protein n=1 Tax=Allobacillus salarius TaxID=1955272 RepID=A0A556PDV8_9BACI|nr:hypothetical protein [Allobacillus salarius]TSJ62569.1 hypothetical protein FPQ13_09645 [Allobacillus salarius]